MRRTLLLSIFIYILLLTILWSPIVIRVDILGKSIPVLGLVKYTYFSYVENIISICSIAVSVIGGLTLISTAYFSHKIERNE